MKVGTYRDHVTAPYGTREYEIQSERWYRVRRRNSRLARLAIRHYLKERGFGADLDIIYFWV